MSNNKDLVNCVLLVSGHGSALPDPLNETATKTLSQAVHEMLDWNARADTIGGYAEIYYPPLGISINSHSLRHGDTLEEKIGIAKHLIGCK